MQKSANPVNQQKKILKFQMKMQAMQQEKQKQMQNLQPVKMSDGQKIVNTFVSTNTGIDMFNSTGMPKKPALLPNPVGMPNMSNTQNPKVIGVRNQNPNTYTPVSVSHTQVHQPEFVETAFYLDHDHNSFLPSKKLPSINAPSTNIQLTNPMKPQQPQNKNKSKDPWSMPDQYVTPSKKITSTNAPSTNIQLTKPMKSQQPQNKNKIKDPWSMPDQYGFKYPKGIPKSFLLQQQQQQQNANSQTTVSDGPIWPSYQQTNAPMMVQSPANGTSNAASPMLAQTDAQGEIAQPYSPSELYTDLDQSHSQDVSGTESPQAKPESGANTKQQLLFWGRKFQEALQEAKLKYKIWAKHNKPRHGPYYKDMNASRKVFKACKRWLNKQEENYKEERAASGSENCEDSESSEPSQSGQKRLSAFRRLGPQKQPKKPKLTISLTVNEDQEVREVVDETEEDEEITPVHLREDIILSTDETVMKYLKAWPWKRNVVLKRSVTARNSKTVMMLEREQMEEIYDKDTLFVQVTVKGYPPCWKKEQVLDLLMDNIRGYSFIPCFIEFNHEECKFLTLRCRSALLSLHKCGFIIRKENVELTITLGQTELTLNQLDFVPRLILRKRLNMCVESKTKLDLTAFTLNEDISHFIYFPLNRLNNQVEIVQVQSDVTWAYLTDLNLSHNRISSLDGFDLEQSTPKLKHLNISYNCIDKITHLLKCRQLPLKTIHLEGNPLCMDYRDPDQYVKVVKMIFSGVMTIDDIPVKLKGDMPKINRNYCPSDARELVDKFLEVYFPLLDGDIEHRAMLQDMYEDHATMTITYNYKLAFGPIYRCFKTLFQNARQLEQDKMDMIKGSMAIVKTIASWPHTEHDPFTFTVDVLYHNETTTILRVDGVLKLTRESLAEDEYLLAFSRTLVLHTRDYAEYKIQMEMLHWSAPTGTYAKSAFAVTAVKTKQMNPKIDSTTDKKLQGELLKIFMKLTGMDRKLSEKCLEIKKWNLKDALDHFAKLLKLDNLELLTKELS